MGLLHMGIIFVNIDIIALEIHFVKTTRFSHVFNAITLLGMDIHTTTLQGLGVEQNEEEGARLAAKGMGLDQLLGLT